MKSKFQLEIVYATDRDISEDDVVVRLMQSLKTDDKDGWVVVSPVKPLPDCVTTEAANMYPAMTTLQKSQLPIYELQRSAYIACATRYRPEVEALRARIKELEDWNKYIPSLSNVPDKTGISREWQFLWEEIEKWYGDIKKKETGQEFLLRMQSTFDLAKSGQHEKIRRALEYLVRDVKGKPNDTRYATAIAKAEDALK